MDRRCFIPPDLRPHLAGTGITGREDSATGNVAISPTRQPAVLVIASEEDETAQYFQNYAREHGYDCFFICVEDIAAIAAFSWSSADNGTWLGDTPVYLRGADSVDEQIQRVMNVVYDVLSWHRGAVIGGISRYVLNLSKPLQSADMIGLGDGVVRPVPSVITNRLPKIWGTPDDQVIVKSISSVRSEVVSVADPRLLERGRPLHCPVQLQPLINGLNIRSHVCGSTVIATAVPSDTVDYRYAGTIDMERTELPLDVAKWCIRAAQHEGLEFAGIDLIRDSGTSQFYCLEINPNPAYHFYEQGMVKKGERPLISEWLLQRLLA